MMINKLKEDIFFAEKVKTAWKSYDQGEFKSLSAEKFLELLEKC